MQVPGWIEWPRVSKDERLQKNNCGVVASCRSCSANGSASQPPSSNMALTVRSHLANSAVHPPSSHAALLPQHAVYYLS
ncbi:hypothetical protein ATANTOWER_029650 [Ataeniobius toweri]|uniref:Uncharacterized protein n=1 Tax=Ataeniobius toweri TaxID=208326 RepID=A0ABU7B4H8_9TELE|nr:hypothetical protein [Ataeniobius toweri]